MPTESIKVASIVPNHFNPNVMQPEEYQALKKDMQLHGPEDVDAILVSPFGCFYPAVREPGPFYVIVDGEHRWTAAKELLWDTIRCEVRELDEEEAKGICYRKNKDRGTIDPFKEAALFKSELDVGLGQKDIAEKFLVDPSTVSHRLSLLKLVPEVKKQVEDLPRGMITPSHLEPIASLPEGEQKKIKLKNEYGHQEVKSVRDLTDEAKRIKADLAEKQELKKALETAKYLTCPRCKKEPDHIDSGRKLPWVRCSSGSWDHIWNLDTGKDPWYQEKVEQKKISGEKSEPVRTSVLRCSHTVAELGETFEKRMREVMPKVLKITSFRVYGKLEDGRDYHAEFSNNGNSMNVSVSVEHEWLSFSAEEKAYRTGEKSKVDTRSPEYVEVVKQFIENAFQGRLEVPEKKRFKGKVPPPAESETSTPAAPVKELVVPCDDCANDQENGGSCCRDHFGINDAGTAYVCDRKRPISNDEAVRKAANAERKEVPA